MQKSLPLPSTPSTEQKPVEKAAEDDDDDKDDHHGADIRTSTED